MFKNVVGLVKELMKGDIKWDIEGEADTDSGEYELLCTSSVIKDRTFKILFDTFLKKLMPKYEYSDGRVGTVIDLKTNVPVEYHDQLVNLVGRFTLKPYILLSKELKGAKIERKTNGWVLFIELKGLCKK